jgi:hypothetical protein
MLDRDALGRRIYEVSTACAEGYRRNITGFTTDQQNHISEQCAAAASNVGYFLLQSLGYSNDEIRDMRTLGQ